MTHASAIAAIAKELCIEAGKKRRHRVDQKKSSRWLQFWSCCGTRCALCDIPILLTTKEKRDMYLKSMDTLRSVNERIATRSVCEYLEKEWKVHLQGHILSLLDLQTTREVGSVHFVLIF